jgi:plastocyanin
MSLAIPSAGFVAAALAVTAIAAPLAAATSASAAPAACRAGVTFSITHHKRVFVPVPGAKITFTKAGTHTVEITKSATLSARYNTGDANDQAAIRHAVKQDWPQVRETVPVTRGHKTTFTSGAGERVTVTYGSMGDRVKWTKVDVHSDCSTTVLDSGNAKFPRRNLNWLFARATP